MPAIAASMLLKPVMLPPGFDRLATKPSPTGSATPAKTMGMIRVAVLESPRGRCRVCEDRIGSEARQFRRMGQYARRVARTPAEIDADVSAFDPVQFAKGVAESLDSGLSYRIAFRDRHQHTEIPGRAGRLRLPRRSHACSGTRQGEEMPSPHSITSSARARTDGGMVLTVTDRSHRGKEDASSHLGPQTGTNFRAAFGALYADAVGASRGDSARRFLEMQLPPVRFQGHTPVLSMMAW